MSAVKYRPSLLLNECVLIRKLLSYQIEFFGDTMTEEDKTSTTNALYVFEGIERKVARDIRAKELGIKS